MSEATIQLNRGFVIGQRRLCFRRPIAERYLLPLVPNDGPPLANRVAMKKGDTLKPTGFSSILRSLVHLVLTSSTSAKVVALIVESVMVNMVNFATREPKYGAVHSHSALTPVDSERSNSVPTVSIANRLPLVTSDHVVVAIADGGCLALG